MIPVLLTIEGLYSFQQSQTIDFTQLTDAHLFGIFGKVGSGKSSVLESIALALYGKTERLSQGDNRNYNMMNLKSKKLLIDFTFRAYDGELYHCALSATRHGKNFGEVNSPKRTAYREIDGAWVPFPVEQIETVVGLSYDNFRRTIIIPQGKFQEFLQLKNSERTTMLKEIFNLDKYEFSAQVNALAAGTKLRISYLDGEMLQFASVSEEQINLCKEEVKEKQEGLSQLEQTLAGKKAEEKKLAELRSVFEEARQKEEQRQQLESRKEEIRQKQKRLDDYEYCMREFHTHLNLLRDLEKEQTNQEHILQAAMADLEKAEGKAQELQQQFVTVAAEYGELEMHRQTLRDLLAILSIRREEVEIKRLHESIAGKKSLLEGQLHQLSALNDSIQATRADIQAISIATPDTEVLVNVLGWHQLKKQLLDNRQSAERELIKQAATQEQFTAEAIRHAALLTGEKEGLTVAECLEHINNELLQNRKEQSHQHGALQELQWKIKLGEFAEKLHEESPCPLCGSTHHPQALKAEDVSDQWQQANTELAVLKQKEEELNTLYRKVYGISQKLGTINTQIENCREKLADWDTRLTEHDNQFGWEAYRNHQLEELEATLTRARQSKQQMEQLQQDVQLQEKEKEVLQQKMESVRKEAQEMELMIVAMDTKVKTWQAQMVHLRYDQWIESTKLTEAKRADLEKRIASIDENYRTLSGAIQQENITIASLQQKVQLTGQAIESRKIKIGELQSAVSDCLTRSSFSKLEEVKAILEQRFDLAAARQEIRDYDNALHAVEKRLEELEKIIDGQLFDEETYQRLLTRLKELEQEEKTLRDSLTTLKNKVAELEAGLVQKQRIQSEWNSLQIKAENLNVLKNLFRANGFVNYISKVYLQNLCRAANDRFFDMTGQQLWLQMDEDNNFTVVDFLNEGKTRLAKTLSGGQTFQASLCLALALADSIQKENRTRQNFFFLDEGFGSLDKENLQGVFNTLKTLRKENRIVGIISHVEELQQEIDMYLKVTNDPQTGSAIECSW